MERDGYELLSPREREVLRLVPSLRTNQRIAGRLGVSANTVKSQILSARTKLGGMDREAAADLVIAAECLDHPIGIKPERVMVQPGIGDPNDAQRQLDADAFPPSPPSYGTTAESGSSGFPDRNRLSVGTRLLLIPGVFLALCVAAAGLAVTFAQLQSWVHDWATAIEKRGH